MKKVLLVDTNYSSEPIYDSLIRSGLEVFVCGSNPSDFLAKSVRNHLSFDYSDIDQTRATIQSIGIDYIVPGCNDRSYQICAELNSEYQYPGIDSLEATQTILNKEKFRKFAIQSGLPVPRVFSPEQVGDVWPLIVKPVDAYSGRGITIVQQDERDSLHEVMRRAKEYSRSQVCIVEEFVEGQLYSHSAFLRQGAIHADFIVEEYGSANSFVVDTSRVVHDFPSNILEEIRQDILRMAINLDLVDGLIHTQFILKGDLYWIIEVTRRCPGDLYAELIERSTGFHYADMYANNFINKKAAIQQNATEHTYLLRHTISQKSGQTFKAIKFNSQFNIEKFVPLSLGGDYVKGSPFGRVGLLFLKAGSEAELSALLQMAIDRKLYEIN